MNFLLVPTSPHAPGPMGEVLMALPECYVHSGFMSQMRNSKLRKPLIFPNFESEGNIIFILLGSKQNYSVLQRNTLLLSFKTVLYKVS